MSSLRPSRHAVLSVAAVLLLLALVTASRASAQDLGAAIGRADSRAAEAAAEIGELKSAVAPAASRFEAEVHRAAPLRSALRSAKRRAGRTRAGDRRRRSAALAEVRRLEAANRKAAEKHDDKVTTDIGFAIAALLLAALALAWGWFRASAAVAALTRLTLGQAIGLCVGGGFLAVAVGTALEGAEGILAVLGSALVGLGIGLAAAFLLARHSAEIQRGRSKPILRRERFPARATQVLAGLFALLCLVLFGTALFAPAAKSTEISTALRTQAESAKVRPPALRHAEAALTRLEGRAAPVLAALARDRAKLRKAKRRLGHAHARMVAAENQAASFSRRLVSLEVREQHEFEAEERRAQKAAEVEEREYAEAAEEEAQEVEEVAAEECDPNYSGCLDPNAVDYDCEGGSGNGPDYTGIVEVLGVDHYGLDADGDGIGCDS